MRAEHIADGVYRLCTLMVNVYFVEAASGSWALVDTGLRGYSGTIRREAERLFDSPPLAILLTHVISITSADCPGWRTDGVSRSMRIRSSCRT